MRVLIVVGLLFVLAFLGVYFQPRNRGDTTAVSLLTISVLSNHSAVLLIFFIPSDIANRPQRALITALAESIQTQLGSLVRVLCIDETDHPDVLQRFAITQLPAFLRVRRGIELWRQQGPADETMLVELIRRLLRA